LITFRTFNEIGFTNWSVFPSQNCTHDTKVSLPAPFKERQQEVDKLPNYETYVHVMGDLMSLDNKNPLCTSLNCGKCNSCLPSAPWLMDSGTSKHFSVNMDDFSHMSQSLQTIKIGLSPQMVKPLLRKKALCLHNTMWKEMVEDLSSKPCALLQMKTTTEITFAAVQEAVMAEHACQQNTRSSKSQAQKLSNIKQKGNPKWQPEGNKQKCDQKQSSNKDKGDSKRKTHGNHEGVNL